MLNVDEVFKSKWVSLDKIRDVVETAMRGIGGFTEMQISSVRSALDSSQTQGIELVAPFADFQTNNGLVIPDTPSCIEIAKGVYRSALGEDIDTTEETHVGRMIEQTGRIISSALGVTAANIMQHDLNSATGAYLDAIGSWFFVYRKSEKKTKQGIMLTVKAGLTGTFTVGKGQAIFDGNGNAFEAMETVTLGTEAGYSSSKECYFEAREAGEIPFETADADYGELASNFDITPLMTEIGYDVESDTILRERIKASRAKSVSFTESVSSALRDNDGVFDSFICENTSSVKQIVNGMFMPPHSIAVIASYDGTIGTAQAIAEILYRRKSCGCAYADLKSTYDNLEPAEKAQVSNLTAQIAPKTVTVTDEYFNTSYEVTFNLPVEIAFGVDVWVSTNKYAGGGLEQEVKDAISSWANGDVPYQEGLRLGENIKAYEIGAAISAKIHDIQIDNVLLTVPGSTSLGNPYYIAVPKFAVGVLTNGINVHIDEYPPQE